MFSITNNASCFLSDPPTCRWYRERFIKMALLRTSFCVCAGDERIIAALRTVKTNIDSGTPTFIQDAAAVALHDTVHVTKMRAEYAMKRKIMLTALAKAGLPPSQSEATFYLWQKAPAGMTGLELAQKFLKLGIVVTPGEWISDSTESGVNPGKEYVRIALVPPVGKVQEAVERIGSNW